MILGVFLCILGCYNRNRFIWGGLNPETPKYAYAQTDDRSN